MHDCNGTYIRRYNSDGFERIDKNIPTRLLMWFVTLLLMALLVCFFQMLSDDFTFLAELGQEVIVSKSKLTQISS